MESSDGGEVLVLEAHSKTYGFLDQLDLGGCA